MKTKFIISLFLYACLSSGIKAQSAADRENYWILEDFKNFAVQDNWIMSPTSYQTYPNNVLLTLFYANVELGYDCAFGQNALRIRGLEENGYVSFTVQDAGKVTLYFTGKQKASDRGFIIRKNDVEIARQEGYDRYDCVEFIDDEPSAGAVTYKITAADADKKDPVVLYYIEVQKYGVTIPPKPEPRIDYDAYWIYEDFNDFDVEEAYNTQKNYLSHPNQIELATDSANVELGEGCSGGYGNKIMRLRGKAHGGGKLEFTVPDAENVAITVTGKSTSADRTVKIFRNNECVKTFAELDRNYCVEFSDDVHSGQSLTYRIEGGDNTEKPIGVKSIHVKKYGYTKINTIAEAPYAIYPNPAYETVYFQSNTNKPVKKAEISDTNGRKILSQNNISQMNVSNLKKGFYIVKLTTDGGTFSYKFIKM